MGNIDIQSINTFCGALVCYEESKLGQIIWQNSCMDNFRNRLNDPFGNVLPGQIETLSLEVVWGKAKEKCEKISVVAGESNY